MWDMVALERIFDGPAFLLRMPDTGHVQENMLVTY